MVAAQKARKAAGMPELQECKLGLAEEASVKRNTKRVDGASVRRVDPAPAALSTALHCPVRGELRVDALAKDGLTPTEEARRIDFLEFLLERDYPVENIAVETVVLKKLGAGGKNRLRCDVIAYRRPVVELDHLPLKERIEQAVLVAEIKRDESGKTSGLDCQLEPAMRQLPGMHVMGAYWDDVHRLLFVKQLVKKNGEQFVDVLSDTLSNLPTFRSTYKAKALTYADLDKTANIVGVLFGIANAMRSHGVNDDATRYSETVKLLLARYCDEKMGKEYPDEPLSLQVYPGNDPKFLERVTASYELAANRYSKAKTLFGRARGSELPEEALRSIVRAIQGIEFSSASNETMQQVFMSFVPAVFKKSLDQYFTPIGLIQAMVEMVRVGPNDKTADPGMGTADFLAAVMDFRSKLGDQDIDQRVFGIDIDPKAYELAAVNMILNKDGQAGLYREDSIANDALLNQEMQVVLCNPPFGENSVERRPEVLAKYALGHRWERDAATGKWAPTEHLLANQQLGILFIERCYKMLADKGRLGIILPEGYLCTPIYGYVRQWIIDHLRILSLTELPRRIFVRSNVDLRSNVLIAQRVSHETLNKLLAVNYPIHAEMVRKVGFKMGKGYQPIFLRDSETGVEQRDSDNNLIPDSDFRRVCAGFGDFTAGTRWDKATGVFPVDRAWQGARIADVAAHPHLDIKPRRLMPRALANVRSIAAGRHVRLRQIAHVVSETIDILESPEGAGRLWRLVEGLDIRAVEGLVVPGHPTRAWQIAERKARLLFPLRDGDIIVGLVRPERRNIGMLVTGERNIVGAPDGIAVVRVKTQFKSSHPKGWLLAALRAEATRLQFWTESGGTSYGKLSFENVLDVLLPLPTEPRRKAISLKVNAWSTAVRKSVTAWETVGSPADRFPVVNSPSFGLVEATPGSDLDAED